MIYLFVDASKKVIDFVSIYNEFYNMILVYVEKNLNTYNNHSFNVKTFVIVSLVMKHLHGICDLSRVHVAIEGV